MNVDPSWPELMSSPKPSLPITDDDHREFPFCWEGPLVVGLGSQQKGNSRWSSSVIGRLGFGELINSGDKNCWNQGDLSKAHLKRDRMYHKE
jgi:hypothetical protein